MSCRCVKDILFLLLKADTQANPCNFFTVHSHIPTTVKILEFYPAHFDLLVTNGLIYSGVISSRIFGFCLY
jgi:hypothetical protein